MESYIRRFRPAEPNLPISAVAEDGLRKQMTDNIGNAWVLGGGGSGKDFYLCYIGSKGDYVKMPLEIGKIQSLNTEFEEYAATLVAEDRRGSRGIEKLRLTWNALKDKMKAEFKAAKFKAVFFDLKNIHEIHQIGIAEGEYQTKIDRENQEKAQASFDL